MLFLVCLCAIYTARAPLIWITGAPGSGKTSAAKMLIAKNPAWKYISLDKYLDQHNAMPLDKDGSINKSPEWQRFLFPTYLLQAILDGLLNYCDFSKKQTGDPLPAFINQNVVIVDGTVGPYHMRMIKDSLARLAINLDHHIHLYCNNSIRLKRLMEREKNETRAHTLHQLGSMSIFKKSPEIKIVDTANLELTKVADVISKYIHKQCYWLN